MYFTLMLSVANGFNKYVGAPPEFAKSSNHRSDTHVYAQKCFGYIP